MLGLPLDLIGYFFRISVVLFTVSSIAFTAHRYNRWLIPSDGLRIVLCLAILMLFSHITIFGMINVWYVGFIPIILISLSPLRFRSELREVVYAAFSMAVCFSKPSLVLLPLVLFRAWRHKEYLLGFILSFSIGLQTLLFLTSSYFLRLPDQASIPILEKILSIVLYPGMVLLKILHAPTPTFFIVMCVSAMIVLLYISLTRILGWRVSVVLGTTVGLLVYTSLFSPDSPMPSLFHNLNTLYTDTSKLQRDILLQALLLLLLFVGYYHFVVILKKRFAIKIFQANAIYLVAPFVFLLLLYRPIDVSSAGLALNNLQQFKGDLRKVTQTVCPSHLHPYGTHTLEPAPQLMDGILRATPTELAEDQII